ncbi:MAG TPA: hypothetical protein VJP02_03505 [Candidatus Sulfotelmatobacter sp.]|nr:hypothetical protein [Candidatus Sulfotelmatobacter sp.]
MSARAVSAKQNPIRSPETERHSFYITGVLIYFLEQDSCLDRKSFCATTHDII